jgi:hypothetical protein
VVLGIQEGETRHAMKERTRKGRAASASLLLPSATRDYGKPLILRLPLVGSARLAFPLDQPNMVTAWTTSRMCYRLRIALRAPKKLTEWDLDFSCAAEEEE